MQEFIFVTGMILKQTPVGEYDRRICLLTKERGKISAFARGARKPGSKMAAGTNPFSFGTFKLYEGKSSYTLADADIQNYFEELRKDYIGAYYGMYFAEVADYYTRENNDEVLMMKLLYQSLRALSVPALPKRLVRCIYEIKAIVVNGEFPGIPAERYMANRYAADTYATGRDASDGRREGFLQKGLQDSTIYAIEYIAASTVEKLYTFTVTDSVLVELEEMSAYYRARFMAHEFKSLEILQTLC